MSKLVLYGVEVSPPVRAVLLTLKALNLPYEFVQVDLTNREHLSPEYLKKNPQHTVPTLDDGGHFLWDSHAIIAYLVSKYDKWNGLYPKDLFQRAVVDQRLHFESGLAFTGTLRNIMKPVIAQGNKDVPKEKLDNITEIYDLVETFLDGRSYIAGDELTIADFSLITTITTLTIFVELDTAKYVRIAAWINTLEQLPYYAEANGRGLQMYKGFIQSLNLNFVD